MSRLPSPVTGPTRRAIAIYCVCVAAVLVAVVLAAFLTGHRRGAPPASVGRGPGVLQAYLTQAPREPKTFTVVCRLSEVYCPEFPRPRPFVSRQVPVGDVHSLIQQEALQGPTYQSVRLEDDRGQHIHGYAPTGSAVANRLVQLLTDGPRSLTVEVQHTGPSAQRVLITRLVE